MSEYVKLEDAMDLAKTGRLVSNGNYKSVCKALESLPTTEIVRCIDCIYNTLNTDGVAESWCYKHGIDIEVDDFCSYAEKQVASKLEIVDTPTNTPTNTPTEDCISRQEAIDMVSKYHKAFVYDSDVDELIVELESLPPSEPRSVCEDAISKRFIQDSLLHRISNLNAQGATGIAKELIQVKKFVDGITPVEPQRPRGEWIEHIDDRNGRRYVKCSSCNKSTLNAVEYDVVDGERHIMDFCPNCGAKMEESEE